MCQAIVKHAGVRIYRKALARAWEENPDSGGFSWLDTDGTVRFKKGYRDFATFWRDYREHQDKDVLIHFRLATHGSKCIENCQPFIVADNMMMAHNGILNEFTGDKKDRSDSRVMAEDVLAPMIRKYGPEIISDPRTKDVMERLIGWNKLVFLSPDGFTIYGEEMGEWNNKDCEGGQVWWSNGYPTKKVFKTQVFGDGEWVAMPGGWINSQYSESTESWNEYMKTRYGVSNVVCMPQLTQFDAKTGAPYTMDDHGDPIEIEDEGEGYDPRTTAEMMIDLDKLDLEARDMSHDQFIDAYIRNKE